jgi:chaperonin GroES
LRCSSAKNIKIDGGIDVLKPLGDRVVLEAEQEEEKTVGGIVLASNAQEKPTTAKVVAVGEGRVLDNGEKLAPSVKEGDRVLFDKYAGSEVEYAGVKYLVVHEKDIVAIVD